MKNKFKIAHFSSAAINEWSDHMGRSYMGELLTALIDGKIMNITLFFPLSKVNVQSADGEN
jgi:hypothetical protein